jgi:membrane protein
MEESGTGRPETLRDVSPEGRRRAALTVLASDTGRYAVDINRRVRLELAPGGKTLLVLRRIGIGVWQDGFIHAGNLAYMAILALFPFFIIIAATFSALGEKRHQEASLHAFLTEVPRIVAQVIEPVGRDVMSARSGWLLWAGGIVALWTVSSLVETIRDILKRAYGAPADSSFLRYRLLSTAIVLGAVILLLLSLFAQVAITAAQEVIIAWFPKLDDWVLTLATSRLIPGAVLYGSIFALFVSLTPDQYRGSRYPKWPGALLVTGWWIVVTAALPAIVRHLTTYNLTYGSLAGVMIALFFFWLVGLGIVVGAELNAALAETPEERDALGQADDRLRRKKRNEEQGEAG